MVRNTANEKWRQHLIRCVNIWGDTKPRDQVQKGNTMNKEETKKQEITTDNDNDIFADDTTESLALTSDYFGKINLARDIAGGGKGYCTMKAEDRKAKTTLYNACANPAKLSDNINIPIRMIHFYVEVIQCANKDTGEIVSVPRVVIIDEKGKGFQAVSVGIYNAIKRIVSMFGSPADWDEPVTVMCQNVDLGGGQHTYNLTIAE